MKIDKPSFLAVSFDLWGTLIKSNPEYRKARTKYIQQYTDLLPAIIENIITTIKRDIDEKVEKFGIHFESLDVYTMIHKQCKIHTITPEQLYGVCATLFLEHRPLLIPGADEVIKKLNDDGYKLYLSSNTVLIDGRFLSTILGNGNLGIAKYFDKLFFSNELKVSKPNPEFFKAVHMHSGLLSDQIIHVGDNAITDAKGSTDYGFRTYLLNDDKTVNTFSKDLYQYKNIPEMFDASIQLIK